VTSELHAFLISILRPSDDGGGGSVVLTNDNPNKRFKIMIF
jgi:hypothetical protein